VISKGAPHVPMRSSLKPHSRGTHKKHKTLTVSCVGACSLIISQNIKAMLQQQSELTAQRDAPSLA